jgi:hypothetical protein
LQITVKGVKDLESRDDPISSTRKGLASQASAAERGAKLTVVRRRLIKEIDKHGFYRGLASQQRGSA